MKIDVLGQTKGHKIAHINCRSLRRKLEEVEIILRKGTLDVLTISENWLHPGIENGLLEVKGYYCIRQDRQN